MTNQPATTTTYTITLADGAQMTIEAEKVVVADASLVAFRAGRAILILAHGQWSRCDAATIPSEQPGWGEPHPGFPGKPNNTREPRLIPATPQPTVRAVSDLP
jgi:hypothetical protein